MLLSVSLNSKVDKRQSYASREFQVTSAAVTNKARLHICRNKAVVFPLGSRPNPYVSDNDRLMR